MICPECQKEIKDGAIKCRYCRKTLAGKVAYTPPRRECPYCRELIAEQATKCEHCQSALKTVNADFFSPPRKKRSPFLLKLFGTAILFFGLAWGIYYYALFKTSMVFPQHEVLGHIVEGRQVEDTVRLHQKQRGIILGIVTVLAGSVVLVIARLNKR